MSDRFLACDLGAESGRLMLGTLSGKLIELEEIHRFPNVPLERDGSLLWNLESIFGEIKDRHGHGFFSREGSRWNKRGFVGS